MTTRSLSLITITLGIALIAPVGAMPAAGHRMMISGTLEVAEEDLHGKPKTLELVSPELGSFRIAPDRRGRTLFAHVGQWVTVFGTVEVVNGVRVVHVESFRPLALLSLLSFSELL